MGFPVGYSELFVPKFLIHLVFLLGFLRRFLSWFFQSVGLGDLLTDSDYSTPDYQPNLHHHHHHLPEFQSVSSILIQEILPVVRFEELGMNGGDESCAVCLYEFEGGEEVRRLTNCRHIFHKGCLDRWMDHDQRTCPLCRTPLIPDELLGAFNHRFWASSAGIPDGFPSDSFFTDVVDDFSPLTSLASFSTF
ncbi:E3 ubiquitin-protein ligase RHA2A [Acorus gramineus]|uniref:E3 ubiquitin-protein ligase RHA2A n=1 Tax=Acorus gramineus TaxID=55184 RepID=A0AAV9ABJ9_ACOGR|nr:E3 ubiquitin-protein ligase RHA2A [Acorus gramineus]